MVNIRSLAALLLVLYGLSIPLFAVSFFTNNPLTAVCIVISCFIIALLLYSGKVLLFNIIIAFYIFKQYLTRPYVDIFHDKLNASQLDYILTNDSYFTKAGGEVVYLSLLSLLIAWTLGLFIIKTKKLSKPFYPRIFREIDDIIRAPTWKFVVIYILLIYFNNASINDLYRSTHGIESSPTFAYGLLGLNFINWSCLAHYIYSININAKKTYLILLIPIIYETFSSIVSGGRGSFYNAIVFLLLYWCFNNFNRNITYKDVKRLTTMVLIAPIVLFSGVIAQSIKVTQKLNARIHVEKSDLNIFELVSNMNFLNFDSAIYQSLYFSLTELFHRLSHLEAQFMILNDKFINLPSETYNVAHITMRIINDLVPGTLFQGVIGINRLFNYIYLDEFVYYSSQTWGIQGAMYLLFGFIGSIIFVFLIALLISRYYSFIFDLVKRSPIFFTFIALLMLDIVENGTLERVILVDIVKPITIMIGFIFMIKILDFNFFRRQFKSN
jgi:hypothetical protein